jgi:hypothetical protein
MNAALADYLTKKSAGLRQLYETILTDDARRVLRINRNDHRRHQARVARLAGESYEGRLEDEDDDMIHVGDIHQTIYDGAPRAAESPPAKSSLTNWIANLALAAGCAGTALAAPAAWETIAAWLSAAAEVKVLWDGQEIKPGDSATAESSSEGGA